MSYCFTDKYEPIRLLYQSSATQVWLVRLRESHEERIAKCISKVHALVDDIFLEANILQELSFPAFPTLFETIEDDTSLIMIEEFFSGESLDHFLLRQQHLSQETFIQFAIQLCEMMEYLHFHTPNPILYLDLKPNHIIVCGNELKLIDFGIANFLPISGKNIQKFGTKTFAAPEQMSSENLGFYTDVYGVGKIFYFMFRFMDPRDILKFYVIARRTIKKNVSHRTQSIGEIKTQLEYISDQRNQHKKNRKHLDQTIAVVGSDTGVGCTHIAIALVTYLNQAGFNAYYRNRTKQQVLENISIQTGTPMNQDIFIYHELFQGIVDYSLNHKDSNPSLGIQIIDCGCNQNLPSAGATIYVCGGRPWQRSTFPSWAIQPKSFIIANNMSKYQAKELARYYNEKVYLYPFQKNAFVQTIRTTLFFKKFIHNLIN